MQMPFSYKSQKQIHCLPLRKTRPASRRCWVGWIRGTQGFLLCSSSFSLKFLNQVLVHKSPAIPYFVTDLSKATAHPVHMFRIFLDSQKRPFLMECLLGAYFVLSWAPSLCQVLPIAAQRHSCFISWPQSIVAQVSGWDSGANSHNDVTLNRFCAVSYAQD